MGLIEQELRIKKLEARLAELETKMAGGSVTVKNSTGRVDPLTGRLELSTETRELFGEELCVISKREKADLTDTINAALRASTGVVEMAVIARDQAYRAEGRSLQMMQLAQIACERVGFKVTVSNDGRIITLDAIEPTGTDAIRLSEDVYTLGEGLKVRLDQHARKVRDAVEQQLRDAMRKRFDEEAAMLRDRILGAVQQYVQREVDRTREIERMKIGA